MTSVRNTGVALRRYTACKIKRNTDVSIAEPYDSAMRIREAWKAAAIDRTDAQVLLAHVLGHDRAWLLAHSDDVMDASACDRWQNALKAYQAGEPVSYITGEREFYGRSFIVDHRVHIPRPSTENLVTLALEFLDAPRDQIRVLEPEISGVARVLHTHSGVHTIIDVGTGSGCMAITMALERPDLRVLAIDKSADALGVARINAERFDVGDRVTFLQGDLLEPVSKEQSPFMVISNPPYLSSETVALKPDLHGEPRSALDGGPDGTEVLRQLWNQAKSHPLCAGIIVECMQNAIGVLSSNRAEDSL